MILSSLALSTLVESCCNIASGSFAAFLAASPDALVLTVVDDEVLAHICCSAVALPDMWQLKHAYALLHCGCVQLKRITDVMTYGKYAAAAILRAMVFRPFAASPDALVLAVGDDEVLARVEHHAAHIVGVAAQRVNLPRFALCSIDV
jgi:hypothetical protein